MIFRNGDWKTYSPFTMMAPTPLVLFVFCLHYLSGDPMFLIINTIVLVGLLTTAVGAVLQRRELLAYKSRALAQWSRHSTAWSTPSRISYTCGGRAGVRSDENESTEVTGVTPAPLFSASVSAWRVWCPWRSVAEIIRYAS